MPFLDMLLARQARGAKTPELEQWPDLDEGLEIFWVAFAELSPRRQAGMGYIGAIPYSEMNAWMQAHNITDEDDRAVFLQYVNALDAAYREYVVADMERKSREPRGGKP